ncbi:transcriptional repressor [Pontibacter sp. BT310]|uniref:Transcriptional repressor n=2 Tax=Pontibacter TaxID=323449 RepID=A0ABS6XG12_9BACT|nr:MULTISPECIES: transcriptional repressor [Pontibacter]MBJ6120077.1 transcriptional repressor [Pontibacter sp. BT310]MBR0572506.1 transcriptional repressor [Microvirga sp. STS03]MBW3366930.1 transcriptional repressor [Pontibacter populi]
MLQNIENTLHQKSIKPTAMRLLVLDFLSKQRAAVSLNDLEAAFHRADRITLYRTLKTFEEKGLVHSIADGTGSVKYALCADDCQAEDHQDLHVHFHCSNCAETYCLPAARIPDISLPADFAADEVSLIVKGVCARCKPENAMQLQTKGQ